MNLISVIREVNKINPCKKCGTCCRAIVLCYQTKESFERLKANFDFSIDYQDLHKRSQKIIFEHWKEITKEKALEINPHLKQWLKKKAKELRSTLFFHCDLIDENNNCTIHDNSPWACFGYPFYESEETLLPKTFLFYNEDCGYKSLVESESTDPYFSNIEDHINQDKLEKSDYEEVELKLETKNK